MLYADMGWPLEYNQIQSMMRAAARKWRGAAADVSESELVGRTYVREFVRDSAQLAAAKTSNLDPLRAKKASVKAHLIKLPRTWHTCQTHV